MCKWRGRKLRKFIFDGLSFFSKVGVDEICFEWGGFEKIVDSNS